MAPLFVNENALGDLLSHDLPIPGPVEPTPFPRIAYKATLDQDADHPRLVQHRVLFAGLDAAIACLPYPLGQVILNARSELSPLHRRIKRLDPLHRRVGMGIVMDADEDGVLVAIGNLCPFLQMKETVRTPGHHHVKSAPLENLLQTFGGIQIEVLLLHPVSLRSVVLPAVPGIDHHRAEGTRRCQ